MKSTYILSIFFFAMIFFSCNKDDQIFNLLNSEKKEDVIKGAYLAGESGKKIFVSALLKNAYDMRTSTNIRFKGYTVYQEKMIALGKIFKQMPPIKVVDKPDSTVIKFYIALSEKTD